MAKEFEVHITRTVTTSVCVTVKAKDGDEAEVKATAQVEKNPDDPSLSWDLQGDTLDVEEVNESE